MSGTKISTHNTPPLSPLGREASLKIGEKPQRPWAPHQDCSQVWGREAPGAALFVSPPKAQKKLSEETKTQSKESFLQEPSLLRRCIPLVLQGVPGTRGHFSEPTESLLHASERGWPYTTFKGRRISTNEFQLWNRTLWGLLTSKGCHLAELSFIFLFMQKFPLKRHSS